jgi:activator of 2-hydroxyglutaryl-CoA dehydratase
MDGMREKRVVATGYGRKLFTEVFRDLKVSAIIQRTVAMLRRVGMEAPLVFAGGVAHNPCARKVLEEHLNASVIIPAEPDLVGAIGAALHGMDREGGLKPTILHPTPSN